MQPLRERAAAALRDPVLQRTLPVATRRAVDKQRHAWADLDADAWRTRAADIKRHTLAHLDHYLERFERAALGNGIRVHWATTKQEALDIIDDLLERHNVKRVIKGKSMTTEELRLNEHLTAQGIETWETDLGEYIVQLSGRGPSHITAPAIHEDRHSIARLFHQHLGIPLSADPDPTALTAAARMALRDTFTTADCGITGANLLVAESGRIVLVENEGNIRWADTRPRLHIAVAGIEKIVPRDTDVPVFLELLARSATGQKLTTYTHYVRGPRRRGDEHEGPDEVHVVLLDNGRTRMLADTHARDALNCIRCGSCLNTCPVYQAVGGHTYRGPYSGPIGAITMPWLEPDDDTAMLPYASTLCGACADACPVRIPIPEILLHLRAKRVAEGSGLRQRVEDFFVAAWKRSVRDELAMDRTNRLGRFVLTRLARDGAVEKLPPPLSGWTKHRRFPLPAKRTFRERWEDEHGQE